MSAVPASGMSSRSHVSVSSSKSSTLAIEGGTPVSATNVPFMSVGLTEADKQAAIGVLNSGMLRAAKKCEELEQRFGAMSGAKHAMTCANGTCALQLAYEPLFRAGDDVLVPAWSYIATVSMVVARGGNPVFVDALPDTYQIDVADAEKRITPKTTAIACTHLYGCPVDIDAVQALAKKHNLKVIYDAAQSHLATYRGKGIGAFGDAVTYSFYATKNLATGEGGMVTCNDDGLARQIKLLRSHGETEKYLHEQVGYNYRMNDITGAIGCSRLDRLEAETRQRQSNAARFDAIIDAIPALAKPVTTPGAASVFHLYVVKLNLDRVRCTRDEFIAALAKEGVPTAVHYPRPLTRQPAFAKFMTGAGGAGGCGSSGCGCTRTKNDAASYPVSEDLCKRVFALPMHHALTDDHFRIIADALRKVAGAYAR
ncbi:MAG: DegT/DnrJ/EryC1/StrS family aminotransferase [Phycisphaerales bacterium]